MSDSIKQNAAAPAEVTVDGQTVKQHSLKDQIEADRYVRGDEAVKRKGLPFKTVKLVPPGTA